MQVVLTRRRRSHIPNSVGSALCKVCEFTKHRQTMSSIDSQRSKNFVALVDNVYTNCNSSPIGNNQVLLMTKCVKCHMISSSHNQGHTHGILCTFCTIRLTNTRFIDLKIHDSSFWTTIHSVATALYSTVRHHLNG